MKAQTVGLVNVGERLPLSLRKLAKILNSLQTNYLFEEGGTITSDKLGKPDLLFKWFEIPRLCALVKKQYGGQHDYLIGITNCRLTHSEEIKKIRDPDRDYFSRSDLTHCAIITVHKEMQRYGSPGKNVYQYAAFIVMCETLIMTAKIDLNHDDKPYCVFHECGDRELFQGCMESAQICHGCNTALNVASVSEEFLKGPRRVLKWCSQNSWRYVCRRTIEDPTITLILGAGVGWFSSIFLSKEYYPIVAALVLVPVAISIFLKRRSSSAS